MLSMSSYLELLCNHWRNKARIFEYRYHRIILGVLNCLEGFSRGFCPTTSLNNLFRKPKKSGVKSYTDYFCKHKFFMENLFSLNISMTCFTVCPTPARELDIWGCLRLKLRFMRNTGPVFLYKGS